MARLTGYLTHQERQGVALPRASLGISRPDKPLGSWPPSQKRTPTEEEALRQIGSLHPHLSAYRA